MHASSLRALVRAAKQLRAGDEARRSHLVQAKVAVAVEGGGDRAGCAAPHAPLDGAGLLGFALPGANLSGLDRERAGVAADVELHAMDAIALQLDAHVGAALSRRPRDLDGG